MLSVQQRHAVIARLRKIAAQEQPAVAVEFERLAAQLERSETETAPENPTPRAKVD
jgi:hypothetical protein